MFMVMVNLVMYGDDDVGDDYHDVYDNDCKLSSWTDDKALNNNKIILIIMMVDLTALANIWLGWRSW